MNFLPHEIAVGYGEAPSCMHVESVANADAPDVSLSPAASERIEASHQNFLRHRDYGVPIYGTTTGFGPHVVSQTGGDETQGAALIAHLGAGYGADAPASVVRAAMLLRLHTLGQGYSGVSVATAERYRAMLALGIAPCVPETGSVGASGDLVPLSHIARVLMGDGEAVYKGERLAGAEALRRAELSPVMLSGRDALALVNGTSFLTAYAALAAARGQRLLYIAETLTGWMYRLLGCRADALNETLNVLHGHKGQTQSAAAIRTEAERFGDYEDATRPLQEVYSLRCAPQVLGACRQNMGYARAAVEAEINGVDDNR